MGTLLLPNISLEAMGTRLNTDVPVLDRPIIITVIPATTIEYYSCLSSCIVVQHVNESPTTLKAFQTPLEQQDDYKFDKECDGESEIRKIYQQFYTN